jgi:hypothetical protein
MMGRLTDDMTRLRGEIDTLRGSRGALMQDLARGAKNLATTVSAMQADFAAAHNAMAKKTSGEREAFVVAMIRKVDSLLDEYSRDRKYKARKGRHDRETFLTEMRRQVTGLRNETADDLAGARSVWSGHDLRKSAHPVLPRVEEIKKKTKATEAPAIKPLKGKAPEPVVSSMTFQKKKEKNWQDKKLTKTAIKGKRS